MRSTAERQIFHPGDENTLVFDIKGDGESRILTPEVLTKLLREAGARNIKYDLDDTPVRVLEKEDLPTDDYFTKESTVQFDMDVVEVDTRAERRSARRKRVTLITSFAIAIAIAEGNSGIIFSDPEQMDKCTTATTVFIPDGGSLQSVAKQVSQRTGFTVSEARLQEYNEDLKGDIDDGACLNLPPPLVAGMMEAPEQTTLEALANKTGKSVKDLSALNPDLPQVIPEDTIIWLTKKPDIKDPLIFQRYDGKPLGQIVDNGTELVEVLTANAALLDVTPRQGGIGFVEGQSYYLPAGQTPEALAKAKLTVGKIIEAQKDAYNWENREVEPPKAEAEPPKVEAKTPTGAVELNAEQWDFINSYDLPPEQIKFAKDVIIAIEELRRSGELDGINPVVLAAQIFLETGHGNENDKTGAYMMSGKTNLTGLKANKDWKGKTVDVVSPEEVNGKIVEKTSTFKVFESDPKDEKSGFKAGILGYRDDTLKKEWRDDARRFPQPKDHKLFLRGLLNDIDEHGNIKPGGKGKLAYATDSKYEGKILDIVEQRMLVQMFEEFDSARQEQTPAPTPEVSTKKGVLTFEHIKLDLSKYSGPDEQTWVNKSNGAFVYLDGKRVLIKDLKRQERYNMMEKALQGVKLSAADYEEFLKDEVDLRAKFKADDNMTDFHGTHGNQYTPTQAQAEAANLFFIAHFTATSEGSTHYSCDKLGRSIQNGNQKVGIQGGINADGDEENFSQACDFTDSFTYHVKTGKLNGTGREVNNLNAFGVEVAASGQEGVTSRQYAALIYKAIKHLTKFKELRMGEPVTPVVNKLFIGHAEANARLSNGHSDFPKIIMDQLRAMTVDVLVEMGHTR